MNVKTIIGMSALAAILAGCGSDGVTLAPTNNTTNSNNTTGGGGGSNNPCATYQKSGQTFQGSFDGDNCTYAASFVSDTNPLVNDLTIEALPNGGLHIFQDSLFVGEDVNANAAAQGVRVPQDGEGPTLNIGAGSLIAFSAPEDYVRIARGSRIFAEGTRAAPIVFSAIEDLRDGTATESDRGLWGGMQLNGNGLTNKCDDAARQPTGVNPHNCHVTAEGRPATYGGVNNAENSGVLRYVQVRYAGYEVVEGDELNGITFNGVGSGTTVEYVQTYTTLDDGFEMFGGAVDLKWVVALNAGDDSYDYSEGYVGDIQFALAIHTSGANTCIEGDNTGADAADVAPYTKLRISNMTCITSAIDSGTGTSPSTKGDSEGPLFRRGTFFEMYNSIIVSNADGMASNECVEVIHPQTVASVETDGFSVASSNVVACTEALKRDVTDSATFDIEAWWTASNVLINDPLLLPATLIEGLSSTNPRAYITAATFSDASTATFEVEPFDVTSLLDNFEARAVPAVRVPPSTESSSFFDEVDFIGAVSADDDWVSGWTVGF